MKPTELNIEDWQTWLEKFKEANPYARPRAAIRIENTMFSTARHFGGMTYDGAHYTYFEPVDGSKPKNPDGTPYVAWLMVREDFLRWVAKELEKGGAE